MLVTNILLLKKQSHYNFVTAPLMQQQSYFYFAYQMDFLMSFLPF